MIHCPAAAWKPQPEARNCANSAGCWPSRFRDLPNLFCSRLSQCRGFSTSFFTLAHSQPILWDPSFPPLGFMVSYTSKGRAQEQWRALYFSAGPAWGQTSAPAPQVPRAVGAALNLCLSWACCQGWAEGTASPECSGFYMEIGLDLTERLSSHFTGEDIEAQSCQ